MPAAARIVEMLGLKRPETVCCVRISKEISVIGRITLQYIMVRNLIVDYNIERPSPAGKHLHDRVYLSLCRLMAVAAGSG